MNDFHSFKNRYFITADIVMERPLHIGRGASIEPTGTDLPIIKTPDGKPYIPGSSIKGVVRSELERILRTLDSQKIKLNGNRIWACDIFDKKCITQEELKELRDQCKEKNGKVNEEKLTQEILKKSCTACFLFGSTEIASRIYFKDAYLSDKNATLKTEIRDGIAIDRDTGTAKSGAKFDYEMVPAGHSFTLEAILENVEPWEAGLFGFVLKSWERGNIAIGGKKSAGLGWGKLQNIKIKKVEAKGLLDYLSDTENKKETVSLNSLLQELKNKLKMGEG